MALGRAYSIAVSGLHGHVVEIEADSPPGCPVSIWSDCPMPPWPSPGIASGRRSSTAASPGRPDGSPWRCRRPTCASTAAGYDLALAAVVLAAAGTVAQSALDGLVLLGELGLDGTVRPVRGVLPAVLAAMRAGLTDGRGAGRQRCRGRPGDGLDRPRRPHPHRPAALAGGETSEMVRVTGIPASGARAGPTWPTSSGRPPVAAPWRSPAAGAHHLCLTGPPGRRQDDARRTTPGDLCRPCPATPRWR